MESIKSRSPYLLMGLGVFLGVSSLSLAWLKVPALWGAGLDVTLGVGVWLAGQFWQKERQSHAEQLQQQSDRLTLWEQQGTRLAQERWPEGAPLAATASGFWGVLLGRLQSLAEMLLTMLDNLLFSLQELYGQHEQLAGVSNHHKRTIFQIHTAGGKITARMEELHLETHAMEAHVAEVETSLGHLTNALETISHQTLEAAEISQQAVQAGQVTQNTMNELGHATEQIDQVVDLITDIAQQTRMLALNATIEAAAAGEAGKGFAVVAAEVKHLAQQAANANSSIAQRIEDVQRLITEARQHTEQTTQSLQGVAQINLHAGKAAEDQRESLLQVQNALSNTKYVSQRVAQNTQEIQQNIQTVFGTVQAIIEFLEQQFTQLHQMQMGIFGLQRLGVGIKQLLSEHFVFSTAQHAQFAQQKQMMEREEATSGQYQTGVELF